MKRFISCFTFSCLAGLSFVQNIFAQETIRETTTDPFGKTVIVERHKLTEVASRIWHSNPNFGMFLDSPINLRGHEISRPMIESFAPRVLNKYKTLLGVDPQQFTLTRAEWDGEFWYVSFEQFYNGISVHTGKFGFTLNSDGNIISIGSDGHPGLDLSVTPQRNAAELVEIAKSRFNAENPDSLALLSEPVLLIYPDRLEEEVKYHLAYKIELHDKLGGDRRRYFIENQESEQPGYFAIAVFCHFRQLHPKFQLFGYRRWLSCLSPHERHPRFHQRLAVQLQRHGLANGSPD